MGLETRLFQKMSQSLRMTPQMQQAIALLQLDRLEYKEALEKELLENPILEKEEETVSPQAAAESQAASNNENTSEQSAESTPPEGSEPKSDWEDFREHFADFQGTNPRSGDSEERPAMEIASPTAESLFHHIIEQVRFADIPNTDRPIVLQIVGNLNRDGYLCSSYEEIAQQCGCATTDVERVVGLIREMDPPGLAARDLKECLLIQLDSMGLNESLEAKIVRDHLDKLEKKRYDQIAKVEQVAVEEVYKAVTAIKALEPRPGRSFNDDAVEYVIPDAYVQKVGNDYVVTLNEEGLPKLRISPYYLDLLKNDGESESANPNKAYLKERVKAASFLIKSIHRRQQTIYKVTESIVKFQREFLDHGIEKLRPMVYKDVADDIGMHESTVSRVATSKYVHTPQGVFRLKFFFSTAIETSSGSVSSSSIKDRIKNLVAAEDPANPISDQKIVEILKAEQVDIARRTVAKYRESLSIQSSAQRKKVF